MSITITEKSIKNKVKSGERVAVIKNIKYPCFESEKHKKLCDRMNEFYCSVAKKYSYTSEKKLLRRAGQNSQPISVGMKYMVALCDEKIVSVVLDLTVSNGKNVKTRRFTQMWGVKKQDLLRVKEVIKTDRACRKKIFSLVIDAAKQNEKNPDFQYFADYGKRLARKFDVSNCFAVPKGLCFFVNAGVLSPKSNGADSFVLSSEELEDVLLGDFLPEHGEKRLDEADIVNNI